MAVGVQKAWSLTANSNGSADSSINFAEGQVPGSLNNSARALMAAVKGFSNQILGAKTTGGSANAQTFTSDSVAAISTAYAAGMGFVFKAGYTNSGACTFNVDGVGAKSIKKGGAQAALAANDIVANGIYFVVYEASGDCFILLNPESGLGAFQPVDATLTAFAALTTADDRMLDFTGVDTMAVVTYATVLNNIAAGGTITAGAGVSPALTIQRDNDAGSGVVLYYVHNSASPAAADTPFGLEARAKDSAGNTDTYASVYCVIVDPNSGSEDGYWRFSTIIAGTTAERLRLGGGLYTPLVSDMGANTINASALFEGDVAVNRLRRTTSSETSGALTTASANAVVNATAGVSIAQNVFTAGDIIWIYNNTASAITITETSGTLRLHGTTTTGNRTLAARGWCEIYFHTAAIFIACGPDIT